MISLIVAEPNPLLRLGIRSVLDADPDVVMQAEILDSAALRYAFVNVRHDVLFVGLGLLREIGVAGLRELRQVNPYSQILVHSYEFDTAFGARAFEFGAIGYLSNDCSSSDLRNALREVAKGCPYISPNLGAALADDVCFQACNRTYAKLSAREEKVFKMLVIGMHISDIACQLDTSVDAVQDIRLRIIANMRLPGASELVERAIVQTRRGRYNSLHSIAVL